MSVWVCSDDDSYDTDLMLALTFAAYIMAALWNTLQLNEIILNVFVVFFPFSLRA